MSETRFTPGPWHYIGDGYVEADGAPLRFRSAYHDYAYTDANDRKAEWDANARLIAAAPSLYEALADCLAVAERPLKKAMNLNGRSPYDIGMAALALARGEQTEQSR